MNFPKSDIYKLIQKVKIEKLNIEYVQGFPENFNKLPVISYSNVINRPKYAFKNIISYENISVQIDIWSKTSSVNTLIFKELVKVMQNEGYQLDIAEDIEEKSTIYRIMTKFRKRL